MHQFIDQTACPDERSRIEMWEYEGRLIPMEIRWLASQDQWLEDAIVEALATLVFDAWLRNWNNVRTDGKESTGS